VQDDEAFLQAIWSDARDVSVRLAYADWLDGRDTVRSDFLRLHAALGMLAPDHRLWDSCESGLSRLRCAIDPAWLRAVEPEREHLRTRSFQLPICGCFDSDPPVSDVEFHHDVQDTECEPWQRLLDLVEEAAADGRSEFAPFLGMEPHEWIQIVTLPPSISKLKAVKHLMLYGSHLVRIPPEIGDMESLEKFTPYTSWRLHWFPYEITRCTNLADSTVSTRCLYGNYKSRPPFPRLRPEAIETWPGRLQEALRKHGQVPMIRACSVCNRPFEDMRRHRVWISLSVATDVLPLLVNACSPECIERLPPGATNYVATAHQGGLEIPQPEPLW
jgi:uncharacterized protein (TIGR02996 family)